MKTNPAVIVAALLFCIALPSFYVFMLLDVRRATNTSDTVKVQVKIECAMHRDVPKVKKLCHDWERDR